MNSIKQNMKEGQEFSKEVLDHMQYDDSDVDDEELQQELEELGTSFLKPKTQKVFTEKEVNEGK